MSKDCGGGLGLRTDVCQGLWLGLGPQDCCMSKDYGWG